MKFYLLYTTKNKYKITYLNCTVGLVFVLSFGIWMNDGYLPISFYILKMTSQHQLKLVIIREIGQKCPEI
jgi:hypothetical protein